MRRQSAPEFPCTRNRGRNYSQYFSNPSPLARDLWSHVICIGASRCPPGYQAEIPGRTMGYLLHYVRAGEIEHMVHGVTHLLRAGSICLFDYSQGHRVQNRRGNARVWWLLFNGKDMPRIFSELNTQYDPVFSISHPQIFEKRFHELWDLVAQPPVGYEVQAHVILEQMLAELFLIRLDRRRTPSLIADKSRLSEHVLTVVNMMERMYYQDITLKQVAELAHLNMNHFMRKFHKEVGVTCMQYLALFRIEQSKFLLRTTNKPVSEIARLVGLADGSYFARAFRRITGQSPQQYREESGRRSRLDARQLIDPVELPGPVQPLTFTKME